MSFFAKELEFRWQSPIVIFVGDPLIVAFPIASVDFVTEPLGKVSDAKTGEDRKIVENKTTKSIGKRLWQSFSSKAIFLNF